MSISISWLHSLRKPCEASNSSRSRSVSDTEVRLVKSKIRPPSRRFAVDSFDSAVELSNPTDSRWSRIGSLDAIKQCWFSVSPILMQDNRRFLRLVHGVRSETINSRMSCKSKWMRVGRCKRWSIAGRSGLLCHWRWNRGQRMVSEPRLVIVLRIPGSNRCSNSSLEI